MYQNPLQAYRKVKLTTTSPAEVLVLLYDGAIRFCEQARACLQKKDIAGKGTNISRAVAIINELQNTLNHSVAPELCGNLEALYVYMSAQLTEANARMETAGVDNTLRVLRLLHEGWKQAIVQLQSASAKPEQTGNPVPASGISVRS